MKKIIFRKILFDCLKFFILSLFSVSIIIWVLQAVNFLDFIIEDGHGFLVYIKYTLLSFPRIISRIFPFILFFSITYVILKYEDENELVIFWNFGITKIEFINIFIKFSFLFLIINILLNSLIVPSSQDKARSYIRSSDLDFFESILKPKKFIDIINNLTIYYDEKTIDGKLKNIFLKDNTRTNGYQVTYAKLGKFELREDKKILVLFNGKTLENQGGQLSEFTFNKTDFNMERFNSKTTTQTKTQENSTADLLKCASILQKNFETEENTMRTYGFTNCRIDNLENIYQEIYRRIILPFYDILLVMIALLVILKSKNEKSFNVYKFRVFISGFVLIIFLETSLKFININIEKNYFLLLLPVIIYLTLYSYFITKLNFKKS
jgi:lipopolysaccharide export system permease protein